MNDDFIPLLGERPPRADAVRNRETLLDVATRLFRQHGADAVTMSQIAEEAGVGKGTLYRHFTNKTSLCSALLDQEQREIQEQTLIRLRTPNLPPREVLDWFLEQVASFVWRNMRILHIVGDSSAPPSLEIPAHLWWRMTLRALLQRCNAQGDLDYLADSLYVMIDVNTLHYQRHQRGYDLPRVLNGIHALTDCLLKR